MTIVEMLVASVLLMIGVLATFSLVDVANRNDASAASRETATNLAREVLEGAHSTPYSQVGSSGWIQNELQGLPDGSGALISPSPYVQRTTVVRRNSTYTVTVTWCSVDDARDGYGIHDVNTSWCDDSATTGTSDGQPEDYKRVKVDVAYASNGNAQDVIQTTTFSASGAAVGPPVTALSITSPSGLSQTAPLITTTPAGGIVTFRATSPGASGMAFTVNGTEQQAGITNNGNGTWSFNWNISGLKDGLYTVGAMAIDALGVRGPPRTIPVTLNRGVPAPLSNLVGAYNYVNVSGTRTLVVELAWDANVEGQVTGYEVDRGSTVICPQSLDTSCMDLNPPSSGTTTYTIKTWYRDPNGAAQWISTTASLTAPTIIPIATQYWLTYDSSNPSGSYTGTGCHDGTGTGSNVDMLPSAPNFSTRNSGTGWISGCLPPFPAGIGMSAGNMTLNSKWQNTSAGNDCSSMPVYLYLNGTTQIAGTGMNTSGTLPKIPKNNLSWSNSTSFKTTAMSFQAGDQLSVYTPAATFSSLCANVSVLFNGGTNQTSVVLPLTGGSSSLQQPAVPTGLTLSYPGDGTTVLTWNAPGGTPAPEFYRIYRDGQDYTDRYDTAGDTGQATITWVDDNTGGLTHDYWVTSADGNLTESPMVGPVRG